MGQDYHTRRKSCPRVEKSRRSSGGVRKVERHEDKPLFGKLGVGSAGEHEAVWAFGILLEEHVQAAL